MIVTCASCGKDLQCDPSMIGREARCPHCQSMITVVASPEQAPPSPGTDLAPLDLVPGGPGGRRLAGAAGAPSVLALAEGVIKGRPTKAGDFTFTLQAGAATKEVAIRIAPKAPRPFWRERADLAAKERLPGPVGVRFDKATDK